MATEDVIVPAEKNAHGPSIALPVWKEIPDYANVSKKKTKTDSDANFPTPELIDSKKKRNGSSSDVEESSLSSEAPDQSGPEPKHSQQPAAENHDTPTNGITHENSTAKEIIPGDTEGPISEPNETEVHADVSLNQEGVTEHERDQTNEAGETEDIQNDSFDEADGVNQKNKVDTPVEKPILPDPDIASASSPALRIPDGNSLPTVYLKEVPVKVSLTLEVGNQIFDCQLIHHLRVFEMRNQMTQERIDILASALDVRDSYGLLNIQKTEEDSSKKVSWNIPEWSMMIFLEDQDVTTNIGLIHAPSGKVILHLQL